MDDQRYVHFILALIQQTKEKKLHWQYLDKNRALYEGMNWTRTKASYGLFSGGKEIISPDFNTEDSCFVNVDDIYIVLYVWGNQPANLYIIPNTYKKVTRLTADGYGDHITRLLNLVQSQFPNAEDFIDKFIAPTKS